MTFEKVIDIRADPAVVWSVMADVERWSEWTASIRSIQRLDGGPLAVGSRVRIRQPKLLPAEFVVTELEAGRSFTWVTKAPGIRATAWHAVEPHAGGSRVTLTLVFGGPFGPLVGWLTRGINARYVDLEANGLKRGSEERQPRA